MKGGEGAGKRFRGKAGAPGRLTADILPFMGLPAHNGRQTDAVMPVGTAPCVTPRTSPFPLNRLPAPSLSLQPFRHSSAPDRRIRDSAKPGALPLPPTHFHGFPNAPEPSFRPSGAPSMSLTTVCDTLCAPDLAGYYQFQ